MRRLLALLIVVLGLAPGTFWRSAPVQGGRELDLRIIALDVPPQDEYARHLGPFELEGIWHLTSPYRPFGGFSALLPPRNGEITAISDRGWQLQFTLPGRSGGEPQFRRVYKSSKMWSLFNDMEGATTDPASGNVWISIEQRNSIARFGRGMRFEGLVMPDAMKDWGTNSGAEAIVRLSDGRFVLLREAFNGWFESREHEALIFDSDAVDGGQPRSFLVSGPEHFSPTEIAQLPDGRLIVLFRRPVWPLPVKFAGRLAIGDPRNIRAGEVWQLHEVARLTSTLPVDNFEGMAVEPRPDGRINLWLISDDNRSAFERTLLWQLSVDPARLPAARPGEAKAAADTD